jgi:WD40 repeat protein
MILVLVGGCGRSQPALPVPATAPGAVPQAASGAGAEAVRPSGRAAPDAPRESERTSPPRPEKPDVSAIIPKIKALAEKNPHSPLPAGPKALTQDQYRGRREKWNLDALLKAYERTDPKDPAWDQAARKFLEQFARKFPDGLDIITCAQLIEVGKVPVAARCPDPVVNLCYGLLLDKEARWADAEQLVRPATEAMEKSRDASGMARYGPMLLASLYQKMGGFQAREAATWGQRAIEATTKAASSLRPGEERFFFEQLSYDLLAPPFQSQLPIIVNAIRTAPGVDSWIGHMLAGQYHIAEGWRLRGGGLADTVTPEGFRGFQEQQVLARSHLLEAWRLHPEHPQAATELIRVTMGIGEGVAGENERFWFDQAVAAQFDYAAAYANFLFALRPRWRGSHEQMEAFGSECLETKRFDTLVPWVYFDAAVGIGSELADRRQFLGRPEVLAKLRALYEGTAADASWASRLDQLKSRYACMLWMAGQTQEAKKLLDTLGDKIDPDEFVTLNTTLNFVRDELNNASAGRLPFERRPTPVRQVAVSPDGQLLAVAEGDPRVRVWDRTTGKEQAVFQGHENEVTTVAFASDSKTLASGSLDGTVRIWDIPNRKLKFTLRGHSHPVWSVAFAPTGTFLASGGGQWNDPTESGELKLWDTATGKEQVTFAGPLQPIAAVAFAPDGKRLATAGGSTLAPNQSSGGGEVKIWDTATGKEKASFPVFNSAAFAVAFAPDGKVLAAAGRVIEPKDGRPTALHMVKLLDLGTGRLVNSLGGPGREIRSLAFGPDGQLLVTGSVDRTVKVWDVATGQERATYYGHEAEVTTTVVVPGTHTLITGGPDGAVLTWDIRPGPGLRTHLQGSLKDRDLQSEVCAVAFSDGGRVLYTATRWGNILRWDLADGLRRATVLVPVMPYLFSLAVSPDGKTLATTTGGWGGQQAEIKFWDVATGQARLAKTPLKGSAFSLAFSPDGKTLATGGQDRAVLLWDVASGEVWGRLQEHRDDIRSLTFSADGRMLATASLDGTVKLWDLPSAEGRASFGDKLAISRTTIRPGSTGSDCVAFSPDSLLLAYADNANGNIDLWDIKSRRKLTSVPGLLAVFAPDGKSLATAAGKWLPREAKLWDVATGKLKATFKGGHKDIIIALAFSPDGRKLVTGSRDRTVQVWEVSTGRASWDLTGLPGAVRLTSPGDHR